MTQNSDSNSIEEQRLRDAMNAVAPKPSAKHNDAVMQAARAKAADRRANDLPGRRYLRVFGIAATLALAFSLVWLLPTDTPPTNFERGAISTAVVPVDGAVLQLMPTHFEWAEIAGAAEYQLSIYDDAAELLWQSTISDAPVLDIDDERLPSSLPSEKGRYFWVVDLPTGGQNETLGPYWFTIR